MDYMIMEPFKLPWMYVSPLDKSGLEYHLSPRLSIHLEGIISGDMEFVVSHQIMALGEKELNALEAEHLFMSEIFPSKSKERVAKSFKDGNVSCFFTTNHMEYLDKLFSERNFMCSRISVYYNDRKIQDVAQLPPEEFKLISSTFEELNVCWSLPHKTNKKEFEEKYDQALKESVAEEERSNKKGLWNQVKAKGMKKKLLISLGSVALSVGGFVARTKLSKQEGTIPALLAVLIGTASVLLELHGRQETQSHLRSLKFGGNERMGFN